MPDPVAFPSLSTPNRTRTLLAIFEVTLAFALMHVAFRAFKRFTDLGQLENQSELVFSPGIAMIVVALAFIALRRGSPRAFGLTLRPFALSINAALLGLIILVACAALAYITGVPFERPPVSAAGAAGPIIVNLMATLLLLRCLQKREAAIQRTPRTIGLLIFTTIPLVPLLVAAIQHHPLALKALTILWVMGGAGIGEEVFFRGYIQSRLNEVFGRPWRIFGVQFGLGLFGAAALFGLVHVLNSADYFIGIYRFMWWHGLVAASTLFCGFLREKYGNIVAPAIVHGFGDLLVRMPQLLGKV